MNEKIIWITGIATVTVSILVKILGLPDQIRKNHSRKSTAGLSAPFFVLGFISYTLWTIYGLMKGDMVVAIGQGVGMVTMGIVAYQIWKYRGSSHES